jgi:TonB family protein
MFHRFLAFVALGSAFFGAFAPAEAQTTACDQPNREASVIKLATPQYPDSARDLGLGPVTIPVRVTVDPDGHVEHGQILQATNNRALDLAAIRVAKTSTYAPKLIGCTAVESDLVLQIRFVPAPIRF